MNTLPIYNAVIQDEFDGITAISLVDMPAVESNFICFSNQEKQMFAIENEEEHIITGVLMLCDSPIYRRNGDFEYYINFSKETIKQMATKLLKDGSFKNINFQHDGELLPQGAVEMIELFIKNEKKGINPTFVENVNDGSLMVSFKINDEAIWKECKDGNFLNGFSLEGYFEVKEEKFSKNNIANTIKNKMSKIKDLFKKLLTAFGAVETQEGVLHYDGDADLKEGDAVFNEDGETASDGEYHTADGKVIKVEDGVVTEILDVEAEVADEEEAIEMEEEETVEEVVEEPAVEEEYDVKSEIEALKAEIEGIKKTIEDLIATPATEPVEEQFSKVNTKNDKYAKLGEAMRNLK